MATTPVQGSTPSVFELTTMMSSSPLVTPSKPSSIGTGRDSASSSLFGSNSPQPNIFGSPVQRNPFKASASSTTRLNSNLVLGSHLFGSTSANFNSIKLPNGKASLGHRGWYSPQYQPLFDLFPSEEDAMLRSTLVTILTQGAVAVRQPELLRLVLARVATMAFEGAQAIFLRDALIEKLLSPKYREEGFKLVQGASNLKTSTELLAEGGYPSLSRYICLSPNVNHEGIVRGWPYDAYMQDVRDYKDWKELVQTHLPLLFDLCSEVKRGYKSDKIVLFFSDIRKAWAALSQAKQFHAIWPELFNINFSSPDWYNNVARHNPLYKHTGTEAQVIINVVAVGTKKEEMPMLVEYQHEMVKGFAEAFGDVGHFSYQGSSVKVGVWEYKAEFYDIEDAMRYIRFMNKTSVPERLQNFARYGDTSDVVYIGARFQQISPLVALAGFGKPQRLPAYPREAINTAGLANYFTPRPGDCRNTIMVRNVPNALSSFELKLLVDSLAAGHYNFMYLRIDFDTGNNVGYGFVNFDQPDTALDFAYRFQGITWNIGATSKVAAVSYATTQGKENQIERFRNSGLREQPAPYRPRLYYSYEEALEAVGFNNNLRIGDEVEFPPPNNEAKLRRSVENGRQTGLYNARSRHLEAPQGLFDNGNPQNFRFA